jgi:hypothetical protein
MALSLAFKLAIIDAYYENGRSLTAVKRMLLAHKTSVWRTMAQNLSHKQILRVVKKLQTSHTLKKDSPPGRSRTIVCDRNIERVRRKLESSPGPGGLLEV